MMLGSFVAGFAGSTGGHASEPNHAGFEVKK
jgi:hypothetical protein